MSIPKKKVGSRVLAVAALVGIAALLTAGGPAGGAGSTSRASAFVSNVDGDTVSVIDPATQTELTTIPVGNEPRNLAANPAGTRVYVPNRFDDSVSVIDTETNAVIATITDASFDEPYAVTVTPDNAFVYVANKEGGGSATGSVTVIDATTNTVVGPIDDPCFSSPEGIVADPTRSRVYLINRNVNGSTNYQVCVIDTTLNTVVATANVGDQPRFGVVTPDGAFLYTSNNQSADVSKVDLNNLTSVTPIATGGFPRNMALSNDGSKVYVATQSDEVAVVTVATNGVSSITFTGAQSLYGVTVIPGTTFGYATDEDGEVVYVWDATTDTEVTGAGFPITGNFDTPRAIASVGDPVVPPPPPPPPPSPAPVVLTPTFTG